MAEQVAYNHLACYLKILPKEFERTISFMSRHSIFFCSPTRIAKIRKPICKIFGMESPERLRSLTALEFERGKQMEPEAFQELIQVKCTLQNEFCNAVLILQKFKNAERLDCALTKQKGDFPELFSHRLNELFKTAPAVSSNFDYAASLQVGNERFLQLFQPTRVSGGDNFVTLWSAMKIATSNLTQCLNDRVGHGFVKALHGDLSWTNVYKSKGRLFFLDPCVASKDMFQIDTLYQVSDAMVEALRYGYVHQANRLAELYQASFADPCTKNLLPFYIARHALIRASACVLYGESDFRVYLEVYKSYGDILHRS